MADIGNQLEGVGDGLDRFLDALDNAAVKLGSTTAMEAKISREQLKRTNQEIRFKAKLQKMEKEQSKNLLASIKNMKMFNKSITDMSKGMLKGMSKMGGAAAKAGAIGGLVVAVKFLIDGLLKVDNAMAALSKRTKMTRMELDGVRKGALETQTAMSHMGVTLEQAAAEGGNLVEAFGNAHQVSGQLIQDSLKLQMGYGVAAEKAAELTETLERSARSGAEFRASIEAIAGKAGVSASLVMRDMASRSKQIAIQNERGTEAMAKMVAQSLRIGASIEDFSGMKEAFSDIDNIAATMADATAIFGKEFAEIMGTQEEIYLLNAKGEAGRQVLLKRYEKAMKAVTTEQEDGTIWVNKQNAAYSDLEQLMERVAKGMGATNEAQKLLTRTAVQMTAQQKAAAAAQDRMNQTISDGKSLLELLGDAVNMVFGSLATTFSDALGMDSSKPGSLRDQTIQLTKFLKKELGLEELANSQPVGLVGFFDNLWEITLKPMFDTMGKYLGEAIFAGLSDGITDWKRNSGWADWLLPDTDKENLLEEIDDLQRRIDQGYSGGRTRKKDTVAQKLEMQGRIAAMQTAAGLSGTEAQLAVAAAAKAAPGGGGGSFMPMITQALGGVHGRGRAALVGEAGGEVVTSRSALRSGIGVGGRAASALAGIGVPGYRTGYATADTSAVTNRQGLQGAYGSQSYRSSSANAFQTEQAKQQASMMEYWRQHYESKMDEAAKGKSKQGPPWLAQFFIKYNKEIGAQLKKTGPTFSAAIMTGMTKWSKGGSLTEAMTVGAKAGITAGLNDPGSKLNELLGKMGGLGDVAKAGMAAFAGGKNVKRAVVGAGARSLAGYIQGGGNFGFGGKKGPEAAAQGKYVNSPTLMMVGEEGRGEVVIPTERIRKGLPINKGVANELGSIGVPGFFGGAMINGGGGGGAGTGGAGRLVGANEASSSLKSSGMVGGRFSQYKSGAGARFSDMGGFGGMARQGAASGLMSFASIYEQTGDWKQAASGGVGAGIGAAAGMGLTALGIPPPLSTMIGGAVGGLATKGINKIFKITGGYGKGRKKSLKLIENHIKTGGRFDFGAPSGLSKAMGQGIGGYEKTPTEANFNKMVETLGTSRLVASMGIPAPALIALAQGQTGGTQASKLYSSVNRSLYGNTPDRYRKALSIPALAAGGIVNRPTTALIGERGPEAVVPLGNSEMMQELRKQNKLMAEMIKTQKETAQTEIRMDGRIVSEVVGQNFYDIGNGL